MSKLLSTYARSTGLQIGTPFLAEAFAPHPFERYITLQGGSNQSAKCYGYFQEVVVLLKPILDANRIAILQLGGAGDVQVQGCHDMRGKTSFLQSHYLVKRGLCHLGNDSWLMHVAGWLHKPQVGLYGSTSVQNHCPYWSDPSKCILLESHRCGGVPTYAAQEIPKTVDFIPPELVANSVLRLLGIGDQFPFSTRFIGPLYNSTVFELVPNAVPAPSFFPGAPMTVRLDYHFDPNALVQVLQTGRKVHLITDRPLDIGFLQQARSVILSYTHELGVPGSSDTPVEYTDAIKTLFPQHNFFTRLTDDKAVAALRFRYFDHANIIQQRDLTKADWLGGVLTYLNMVDTPENRAIIEAELPRIKFKSNKYILSGGSVFTSVPHMHANQPISDLMQNTLPVIDDPALWRDAQHHLYTYHP